MATLDTATLDKLERFRAEVGTLPNESAKTHRFMALVAELFPGSGIVARLAGGIEKVVRIPAGRRRIDSYYGNALIEFEKSLDVSLSTAQAQLREQAAGLWNGEDTPERPLLCIASDGLRWETYQARLTPPASGAIGPGDVELESLQSWRLSSESLSFFWLWLTGLLFRDQQVLPTADRFQFDFGSLSPAYLDGIRRLRRAWAKSTSEAKVAFAAWRRYLIVTYGSLADSGKEEPSPETIELFLKHTFLAMIARLLTWASLSRGQAPHDFRAAIMSALDGSFFRSRRIENLVESDFFQWAVEPNLAEDLLPAWEKAVSLMLTYDLARLSQDVLKGVYQELVDPKDRHDLGEYYTPEWLCERLVAEMMPETGVVSVLDPTCGSGSFLRAAIAHLVTHNPEMDRGELLAAILEGVVGIDIHPLAVTIARATYVLALGELTPDDGTTISIPVYLADALFLPTEIRQSLYNGTETEIRFGLLKDRVFYLPTAFLDNAGDFDAAIRLSSKVAADHAVKDEESPARLKKFLTRRIPGFRELAYVDAIVESLWDFVEGLAELIRKHEDSIWPFVILNGYRPALMKSRFDLILGNPPWLSYRYISDPEYQERVKTLAVRDYAIASGQTRLLTQMELATVFLFHALSTFGKVGARLGFVMPRSVLTADQHEPLRRREYKAEVALTGLWDLMEVRPVFNVPTCVLFATKISSTGSKGPGTPLPTIVWEGRLPGRNLDWSRAESSLSQTHTESRLVTMGSRTAFSVAARAALEDRSSAYLDRFLNGATIYPRNFFFVSFREQPDVIRRDGSYWIVTDEEQAKGAKPPYKGIRISGRVEGQFLFRSAISKHILPFAMLAPAFVVLPVLAGERHVSLETSDRLSEEGFREVAAWMKQAEEHWSRHRSVRSAEISLYQWLNYQGKLTNQDLAAPHLVLYNAAGTNISAAVFSRKDCPQTFIVDHKLYYFATRKRAEADYLAAILNASVVNLLIKPFQSVGLQGERDIHKKVLELPIPLYDDRKPEHKALAKLGAEAAKTAAETIASARADGWPAGLARRREIVRNGLSDVLGRIDVAVKKLFGVAE